MDPRVSGRPGILTVGFESVAGALNAGTKPVCGLIAGRDSWGDVPALGREKPGCERLSAERPNLGTDGDVDRDSKGDVRILGCDNLLGGEELSPERPNLGADGDENRGSADSLFWGSLNDRVAVGAGLLDRWSLSKTARRLPSSRLPPGPLEPNGAADVTEAIANTPNAAATAERRLATLRTPQKSR